MADKDLAHMIGLLTTFLKIPHEGKQYFEVIPWIIFGVLVFDLYLKYIIVGRDWKLLIKHHWPPYLSSWTLSITDCND